MDSIIDCIKLGAEDYLPKPFDPVLLHARLGASLRVFPRRVIMSMRSRTFARWRVTAVAASAGLALMLTACSTIKTVHDFDPGADFSSFRTWAYTLARHALYRLSRDPHRRRERNQALSGSPEVFQMVEHVRTATMLRPVIQPSS